MGDIFQRAALLKELKDRTLMPIEEILEFWDGLLPYIMEKDKTND